MLTFVKLCHFALGILLEFPPREIDFYSSNLSPFFEENVILLQERNGWLKEGDANVDVNRITFTALKSFYHQEINKK